MSYDIVVSVKKISKCFQIYKNPKDRLKQFLYTIIQTIFSLEFSKIYYKEFWALKDISFEIRRGETIVIIGRNGSGKSTLLQILCGTLNPTHGCISLQGRIAALLELGSGFNPEFTGRENVYLNGSLFGLTHAEISDRFQQILDFAEIGEFIDQPVKKYSSGMFVRLAFSVIAHLDADILIIDEALSVGDALFNQKCMRFLRKFKEKGTLIFVSHDTNSVINLCNTAIWIDEGKIKKIGNSKEIIEFYTQYTLDSYYGDDVNLTNTLNKNSDVNQNYYIENLSVNMPINNGIVDYNSTYSLKDNLSNSRGWSTGLGEIIRVEFDNLSFPNLNFFKGGENVCLTITANIYDQLENPVLGFLIKDRLGQDLLGENTMIVQQTLSIDCDKGDVLIGKFVFRLPMLQDGTYSLATSLAAGDINELIQHHWVHDAILFDINSSRVRWGLVGAIFEHISMDVKK